MACHQNARNSEEVTSCEMTKRGVSQMGSILAIYWSILRPQIISMATLPLN